MNQVEGYIASVPRWRAEMVALRVLALGCGLGEALKWGKPCFTHGGANVAILQPFRDECRLMFFKGAILPDPEGILGTQGANTQGARVVRLRGLAEVTAQAAALRALLAAAMAAEEAGLRVPMPAKEALDLPPELVEALDGDAALAEAFAALTPGRQRSWVLHVGGAKQAATRRARIEKAAPAIRAGRGWNER